jgi:WD40 repeat protein
VCICGSKLVNKSATGSIKASPMRNLILSVLVLGCGLLVLAGDGFSANQEQGTVQKIEPEKVDLGRPIDFDRDIFPILEANCVACHNVAVPESMLSVEDVKSIFKGGKRGPAVVPKHPEKSLLYQVASRGDSKLPAMPPIGNQVEAEALTPKQLGLLRQWILEGATSGVGASIETIRWQQLPPDLTAIYSIALSPWGRLAASGRANQISIYDVATGEQLTKLADPNLLEIQNDGKPMYGSGAAHRDFVHSLAFSPDGSLLASGGYRVVKLWQRPFHVQKRQIVAANAVTAVTVSADGKWLAYSTLDNRIKLTNLHDGKPGRFLIGHTARVTRLQFGPTVEQPTVVEPTVEEPTVVEPTVVGVEKVRVDKVAEQPKLFSSSLDQSVRVWKVPEGTAFARIDTPAAVNGFTLTQDATQVITAGADNLIRVFNTSTGPSADKPIPSRTLTAVSQLAGHRQPVSSVALILPGGTQIVSGSEDGTVRTWDLNTGKQIRSMNHGGPVTAVAARPDGQMVASAGADNVAKLWQVSDGKQIAVMKGNLAAQRRVANLNEKHTIAKQRFSQAAGLLKSRRKNVTDRKTAAQKAKDAITAADKVVADAQHKLKAEKDKLADAKAELAKQADDKGLQKKVADAEKALADATAAMKNATDSQTAAGRARKLADRAVAKAQQQVEQAQATQSARGVQRKKIADVVAEAQSIEAAALKPLRAIAFSPDGKKLAITGDSHVVHLFHADNGTPLEAFIGHQAPVLAVAFGPGSTLVSGAADKKVIVWETNPHWKLIGQLGPKPNAPLDLTASPFVSRVLSLDFNSDGKLLATGGGDPTRSGELMIWDVANLSLLRHIEDAHSDTVLGVEFSYNDKFLASAAADKFVKVFEAATGKHVHSFEGHTHHVLDVSWKADGTSIASAGADNLIKVWNAETGEQRRTIKGYGKQVTSIQYIGVGGNIVSCSGDKHVRFHKTGNGKQFRNFAGGRDFMYAAAASRDESFVVAGGEDGVLRIWNGKTAQSLGTFGPPQ